MIADILRGEILTAVRALGIAVEEGDINLEHPADVSFGDYSTNIAMALGKKHNRNPKDLAAEIAKQILKQNNENLDKVEVAGPGFINFYLAPKFLINEVNKVLLAKQCYGSQAANGKKVLVEYSSPNIAKPLHVGHLRSTIIGDAVANILAFSGFEVVRDNHLGDWGTQFGKQIVAIKKWGDEEELEKSGDPLKMLVELYVKFHEEAEKDSTLEDLAREWTKKMEDGDAEAKRLWEKIVAWSMMGIKKIYDVLEVKFDTYLGESFYMDKTGAIVAALEKKSFYKKSEDARLVFFDDDKYPPLMILKKDGSTVYATRDLATDLYRKETYGDELTIINEVGGEQALYFKQIFETEKILGWFKDGQRVHVMHGMYRFKDGKLSTRKGKVIWVEDILDEAIDRAKEFNPEIAEDVGIGAIKYNDLKRDSRGDIVFDWNDILNLKGDSGPYLQYAYARTQSILEKAKKEGVEALASAKSFDRAKDEITLIEKMLYRFPEVVARAAREYAPHHIATYLFELANAFNGYYSDHQIVSQEANSSYRVALTAAVGQTLANGLHLLGIKTPAKM
ncbi:MAG: arginine--tRNA ligase [Candidatus Vogelbacteria bacterium]|nr:arginine--tRNA ligase [Candidatus Vogelbacteria bacterium]